MDIKELHSFKLSDAITFHDKLNPKLFVGTHLRPEVEKQLKIIAQDFLSEMGVKDLDVQDITISGSNAAYSYTDHSDLDLHILVDMNQIENDEVYREFFDLKKTIYNDSHDITINGIPVELYIQDSNEPVVSLGEYSILQNKWLRIPSKRRANFDQNSTKAKYDKLASLIELALQAKDLSKLTNVSKTIKRYRQAGLDKGGEFGPENIAYKALRSQGYITKLYALRDKLHSKHLSIESMYQDPLKIRDKLGNKLANEFKQYKRTTDEDYDPNGVPPGPEFKPTMPAGTVRVDVSDVYDWYKLGRDISDLSRANPKDYGKGPPSTIMAFGSEPEEHKYINALKKLGLSTTDIDPLDPNQPKNMPRQTVDTTYNVNETSDEEIHNYSKLDKILRKLCEMVVKGQSSDKDYGMVGACVLDPDNKIVAGLNSPGTDGKRVHAERVAIEKYEQKYGEVPAGSIVITTLSPCNESDDETAEGRLGESCTDYLNSKGIEKVYCGYIDPTQDNNQRQFNLMETSDQDIRKECKKFADTFLKQDIHEAFDQPYPIKWETSDYGDVDALARLPDGSPLSIMFNQQQDNDGESITQVEFYRNNSQEVTGEGDAQRIFATVLTAIQKYVTKYKPLRLTFSASKDNWAKQQQNSESRASLYDRLVQRYAKAWGYRAFRADNGDLVIYELSRIKPKVAEGKQPGKSVVDAILKVLPMAQEIWFHGSRATGKHRSNSDTDILVVVPDDLVGERYLAIVRILQKLSSYFDNYDIQPTKSKTNIHRIAQEEGRLLWSNKQGVVEASGYIPSEKQKNDPRFKTALTVDVHPDSIKKNAKAFNMYTSRAGIPPTANPNGKF